MTERRRRPRRPPPLACCPLLVILLVPPLCAQAEAIFPAAVFESRLDNGLTLVTIPWDSPGVLAYSTLVRTGCRDEVEPGRSGFAHFFEHMMFRGTERIPAPAYAAALRSIGTDGNALTGDDHTEFHVVAPARALEQIMELEADRFQHLAYSESGFRTEAQAVLGEYHRLASNPLYAAMSGLRELAFEVHPYRHTPIGWLEDIQRMPAGFAFSRRFFARFYRPENTFVVVVGDVEPSAVAALARRYYGEWQPGYRPVEIPAEPPQTEPRRRRIGWPSPTQPYLLIGLRAPAFSTTSVDTAAIDVIAQLLFAEDAPLYRELVVERQVVDLLTGNLVDHRDPYLFEILIRARSEEQLGEVESAVDRELRRLRTALVDPTRLARVKSHLRYDFALTLDNPAEVASAVTHYLSLTGEVETLNRLYRQYERVTPEDVRRLARSLFREEARSTVVLASDGPAAAEGGE